MKYIIGSRGSKLALVQSNYVCSRLNKSFPEHEFHVEVIKTKGDLILDRPLNQIGDKGLFVTEIENKLLTGDIHLAVHSMKDMPAIPASGLMFSKAWTREDPRDALILREKTSLKDLPLNAVIATGSIRRSYQLKNLRPDIQIVDIRGNVDTRIRKMNDQKLDGLVLAAAGLHRLGLKDLITHYFSSDEMVSAPAQGILAIEVKCGSDSLLSMLNQFSDNESEFVANAERTFLRLIDGDCHVPIGAICTKNMNGNMYTMKTMYGNSTTSRVANATVQGTDPVKMAEEAVNIIKQSIAGTVTLVGAGPGDVGLITVKGLDALKNADCVIYDRLASPRLLNECKDRCEKIYVGKASSNHTMKQDDINQLLVKKSMQYESVVRLKGGDVYVFGRGGEEAITLFENKIPFEVIPGISSSIAGLAYAGIPIKIGRAHV